MYYLVLELNKKQPFYIFGCGVLAGSLASFITQPFDVIKTSQQISKDKILLVDTIILINRVYYISIVLFILCISNLKY